MGGACCWALTVGTLGLAVAAPARLGIGAAGGGRGWGARGVDRVECLLGRHGVSVVNRQAHHIGLDDIGMRFRGLLGQRRQQTALRGQQCCCNRTL